MLAKARVWFDYDLDDGRVKGAVEITGNGDPQRMACVAADRATAYKQLSDWAFDQGAVVCRVTDEIEYDD